MVDMKKEENIQLTELRDPPDEVNFAFSPLFRTLLAIFFGRKFGCKFIDLFGHHNMDDQQAGEL